MRDQFFVLFLIAVLVVGCQSKTKDDGGGDKADNKDKTSQSSESDKQTDTSMSHLESVTLGKDAEPHKVCEALLKLLQEDDTVNAQHLFTREATAMMLRFDLPLAFPGEPDATFEVSPARFATSKQEICQVLCTISEEIDGRATQSEIGWMLKRSSEGWRVSGMLLPAEEGKPMDFLNFESSVDIGTLKTMLSGEPELGQMQATNSSGN